MPENPEQPGKYFEIIIAEMRRHYRRVTTFIAIASFAVGVGGGWAISQLPSQTHSHTQNNKPTTSLNVNSKSDHSLTVPGDTSIKAAPEADEPVHGHESDTDVQPLPGSKAVQGPQTPTPAP